MSRIKVSARSLLRAWVKDLSTPLSWACGQQASFHLFALSAFVASCPHFPFLLCKGTVLYKGFLGSSAGKEPACQYRRCKRHGFDPWVGKIPWRREWKPTQYACLGNFMDRETCRATVRGVAQSQTRLRHCLSGSGPTPS